MMTQTQSARGADLDPPSRNSEVGPTSRRASRGHVGLEHRSRPRPVPELTVSALDRLIARIETGTATPEDVDGLPDGVIEYLHAALTSSETGVLDQDWQVTPTDGILVYGTR